MAGEFGGDPDTAVARMTWALATIRTVYPAPSTAPTHTPVTASGRLETTGTG